MVYSNKCVACVLVGGTPQKELRNGVVEMPFDTEYALRLRNRHPDRTVVAKIYIDGENVSEGGFVINPNDKIDIERPYHTRNKFKFVSLDSPDAIEFGKNGPNPDKVKGLIECHFHLVIDKPKHTFVLPSVSKWTPGKTKPRNLNFMTTSLSRDKRTRGGEELCSGSISDASEDGFFGITSWNSDEASVDEYARDGCTVEGSRSAQCFSTVSLDIESDYTTVKIFLQAPVRRSKPSVVPVVSSEPRIVYGAPESSYTIREDVETDDKIQQMEALIARLEEAKAELVDMQTAEKKRKTYEQQLREAIRGD